MPSGLRLRSTTRSSGRSNLPNCAQPISPTLLGEPPPVPDLRDEVGGRDLRQVAIGDGCPSWAATLVQRACQRHRFVLAHAHPPCPERLKLVRIESRCNCRLRLVEGALVVRWKDCACAFSELSGKPHQLRGLARPTLPRWREIP